MAALGPELSLLGQRRAKPGAGILVRQSVHTWLFAKHSATATMVPLLQLVTTHLEGRVSEDHVKHSCTVCDSSVMNIFHLKRLGEPEIFR